MLHYYQRCQKNTIFRIKHLFIHIEVAIVDWPLIIRKCGHNNGNGYSHYNKGNVYHHHDKGDDVYHHHDKGICYHQILIKTWSLLTILLSQLGGLFESNQWMIITDGMLLNSTIDHHLIIWSVDHFSFHPIKWSGRSDRRRLDIIRFPDPLVSWGTCLGWISQRWNVFVQAAHSSITWGACVFLVHFLLRISSSSGCFSMMFISTLSM